MIPIVTKDGDKKPWYDGIRYDSKEEVYFSWWLDDVHNAGYITEFDYHCENFLLSESAKYSHIKQLKAKIKLMPGVLLSAHFYKPDFKITWSDKAFNVFFGNHVKKSKYPFFSECLGEPCYVDVKGGYEKQSSRTQVFTMNQKWMYFKYSIYIQKIVPEKLFAETFYPSRYCHTDKSMKLRKGSGGFVSLKQFETMKIAEVCGL